MLITAHTIAGGTIGRMVEAPSPAFLLALISHFILDLIPHYDTTDNQKLTARQVGLVIADFALVIFLLIFWVRPRWEIGNPVLWGIAGANLPDLLDNLPAVGDAFRRTAFGRAFHRFHQGTHTGWRQPGPVLGLAIQYLLVFCLLLLFY